MYSPFATTYSTSNNISDEFWTLQHSLLMGSQSIWRVQQINNCTINKAHGFWGLDKHLFEALLTGAPEHVKSSIDPWIHHYQNKGLLMFRHTTFTQNKRTTLNISTREPHQDSNSYKKPCYGFRSFKRNTLGWGFRYLQLHLGKTKTTETISWRFISF